MVRRAPDYDWFTYSIIGAPSRAPKIDSDVAGLPINACTASTLLIKGRNIWRADKVLVLGQLLQGSAITIAPDMDGIIVNVPPIQPLAGPVGFDPVLHVITPFGRDKVDVKYQKDPSGDGCKPKKAEPAVDPSKPAISGILPKPLHFSVPADFTISVEGTALEKITEVTLHGNPGALFDVSATSLKVKFTTSTTSGIPASKSIQLMFFTKDKEGKKVQVGETALVKTTRK